MTTQPIRTFQEPVGDTTVADRLPRTFILCTEQAVPAIRRLHAVRAQAPGSGWRYRELPTEHSAWRTLPRELTDLLLEVV